MAIESINPANGHLLRRVNALDEVDLRAKIAHASEAYLAYRTVPFAHRALWLQKLAAMLESEMEEVAGTITMEMGKPISAARSEVLDCSALCRYFAEHAARMLAPEAIATETSASHIQWESVGVVLAVVTWNFPLLHVFRFLPATLMAGNASLLKHASNVPQCALLIESLVRRAGFPRGVFQTLLIEAQQVKSVLSDHRVSAVTVTGDEADGGIIAAQAGGLMKKCVLHVEANDVFLIMSTADISAAIRAGVHSRSGSNQQAFPASRRFLVMDEVYQEFERGFVRAMEQLPIGDPMHADTVIGPLPTAEILEDTDALVRDAVSAGARVLTGGARVERPGSFYRPTVLAGVPRTASVYRKEVVGPLMMLFRIRSLEQAIQIVNETPYSSAASVWTRDPAEQGRLVADLACGAIFLNATANNNPGLSFGDIRQSRYGRELSATTLREFIKAKTVIVGSAV